MKSKSRSIIKKLRLPFIFMFCVLAVVVFGVPLVAKYIAVDQLTQLGAKDVVIEQISLNPFIAKVGIKGLQFSDEKRHGVALASLDVNVSFLSLLRKQIVIEAISLDGLDLSIEKDDDQLWVGIPIDLSASKDPEIVEEADTETEFDWGLGLAELSLRNLSVQFQEQDFSQALTVSELKIKDLYTWQPKTSAELKAMLTVEGSPVSISATAIPFAEDKRVSLSIIADRLKLAPYEPLVKAQLAQLSGFVSMEQAIDVVLKTDGRFEVKSTGDIGVDEVRFFNKDQSIPLQSLDKFTVLWEGELAAIVDTEMKPEMVKVKGHLVNEGLGLVLSDPVMEVSHQGLSWLGSINGLSTSDGGFDVKSENDIELENLVIANTDASTPLQSLDEFDLTWKGDVASLLDADMQPKSTRVQGTLSNTALVVKLSEPALEIGHQGFTWNGSIDLKEVDIDNGLIMNAQIDLDRLIVGDHKRQLQVVKLLGAKLEKLMIAGLNQINVGLIQLSQLSAAHKPEVDGAPDQQALLKHLSIDVSGVQVSKLTKVIIDKLELTDLQSTFFIGEAGEFVQLDALSAILGAGEPGNEPAPELVDEVLASDSSAKVISDPEAAVTIWLKEFAIVGDSHFTLDDRSVSPDFKRKISVENFQLNNIELSESPRELSLDVALAMDDGSAVKVSGTAVPLLNKVDANLTVDVDNIKLIPLSVYVNQSTGYKIKTGKLDLDTSVKIVSNQLDVNNRIVLNNIELTPSDKNKLDKLAAELTMPLDYALNILRDKNANVVLKIPITGDLNKPDFSVNDVFKIAMRKALKLATLHYLKNMLAPWGTAITVAQFVGGQAMKIRIDSVIFEPQSARLSDDMKDYLAALSSNLLREKPQLRLKLCGYALSNEYPQLQVAQQKSVAEQSPDADQLTADLDAKLLALSEERALTIYQYLVEIGVDHQRLFECSGEIDYSKKAKPRVELSL